jgi:GTP-binding protein
VQSEFVCAAAKPARFPEESLPEVAFLGRSNVGKSSLLNCLVEKRNLASTSRTPGRTQTINFYRVEQKLYLVDLPGYGYAKVPAELARSWKRLAEEYLLKRKTLALLVLILDARRGWMESDLALREWLRFHGKPYLVVATKIDKLNQSERTRTLARMRAECAESEVVPFSALTGQGVKETWQAICKRQGKI